jgi:hypothetical protein
MTFEPTQIPHAQVSVSVQGLPSSQDAPSGLGRFEQTPVAGSQVPAVWHESGAVHTTGFDPVQTPAWQVSVCVQALPSLQAVPLAAGGLEQTPVEGLQVPATWHWSAAVHTTGFDPMQTPAWQVSVCVQALPSLQAVPLVALDHAVVDVVGVHTRQALVGSSAPGG